MSCCRFVACGPTAIHAGLMSYGDLVTFNRAIDLFPHVDLAFIGTVSKTYDTAPSHHKASKLLPLYHDRHDGGAAALELLRRTGRMVELPYVSCEGKPPGDDKGPDWKKIRRDWIRAGNIMGRAGVAIVQLIGMGYDSFWLFGHDGGHGRAAELGLGDNRRSYDMIRYAIEELLKFRRVRYAFYPEGPPR